MRAACWAGVGVGCLLTGAYVVVAITNQTEWVPEWLYFAPATLVVMILWATMVGRSESRVAWGLVAVGMTLWVGGDAWISAFGEGESPLLTVANIAFTGAYVCLIAGVSLAAPHRRAPGGPVRWLAGYVAGAAAAALVVAVMLDGVATSTESLAAFVETTWFILAAIVTIAVVTVCLCRAGWYPGRQLGLLCAAVGLNATVDLFYLSPLADGSVLLVSAMDIAWLATFILFAVAALLPADPARDVDTVTWRDATIPTSWMLLALAIVVADGLGVQIPISATLLATLALALGGIRAAIVFGTHMALVEQMRTEARHDQLTGLPNRRALVEELSEALAEQRRLRLVLLDLNGFKAYNDTRGHQEGDLLLARLGDRLARLVQGRGRAYRLGGDEFCVAWPVSSELRVRDIEHALSEPSSRTPITAACGEVEIPLEATELDVALRMADARMYASKLEQRSEMGTGDDRDAVEARTAPSLAAKLAGQVSVPGQVAARRGVRSRPPRGPAGRGTPRG